MRLCSWFPRASCFSGLNSLAFLIVVSAESPFSASLEQFLPRSLPLLRVCLFFSPFVVSLFRFATNLPFTWSLHFPDLSEDPFHIQARLATPILVQLRFSSSYLSNVSFLSFRFFFTRFLGTFFSLAGVLAMIPALFTVAVLLLVSSLFFFPFWRRSTPLHSTLCSSFRSGRFFYSYSSH